MKEYKTQMEAAKKGIVTPEMETVAKKEYKTAEEIRALVASGEVCIPANINHTSLSAEGIGSGLRTKINVNLGISGDAKDYQLEMKKVDLALELGAEARMNFPSTLGNNWKWRLLPGETDEALARRLLRETALYGRLPE